MEIKKKKYTKWSFKIILILIGLLFIKVSEAVVLQRIIHWIWKIPLDGMEEIIDIIVTVLIFMPFLFIVMKQRITLERAEEKYKELAYYDPVTGLSNRRYFDMQLSHSLMRKSNTGAVLLLDIDGFKQVNDTYGHDVGDLLLKEIGSRLMACIGSDNTVSRFAGDEFIIYLPNTDKPLVLEYVEKIINEINKPATIDENQIMTSTSIGIAFFPEHGIEANTLMKNADIAMYKAKLRGKNTFVIFELPPELILKDGKG
ncbi:diguanylate cyclase domain-containing protein [Neobacillus sp. GCM10023253]|uniref:diguanylate cyclase domain-containing protein n=1 Tax=Neobacillus sp. GCM10023253 TaxID=3252644 RepID=UPI00361B7A60